MVIVLRIMTDLLLSFHPPATLRLVPESELTVNHHLAHSVSGADWHLSINLMMLVMAIVVLMMTLRSCPKLSSSTERRLRPTTTGEVWGTPSESWEERDYSGKPGKMVIGDYSGNDWETSFEHLRCGEHYPPRRQRKAPWRRHISLVLVLVVVHLLLHASLQEIGLVRIFLLAIAVNADAAIVVVVDWLREGERQGCWMQPLLPTFDHLRLTFIILKYHRHFYHHHHRPPEDGLGYFEAHHVSQCCIVTCEYVITFLDVTIYKKNWLWNCQQLRYCNLSIQYYAFCETCGCGVESNFGVFS